MGKSKGKTKMPLLTAKDSLHGSRKFLAKFVSNSVLAATLAAGLVSSAWADVYPNPASLLEGSSHVDGISPDMKYRYFQPLNYDPNGSTLYPLVIALHGLGGQAPLNNLQQLTNEPNIAVFIATSASTPGGVVNNQVKYPCFFIAPQTGGKFEDPGPEAQLTALVKSFIATHKVDPNRVYITGLSLGGGGVFTQIQDHPELYAAAAPASGYSFKTDIATVISAASHKLNIWAFHNADDPTVTADSDQKFLTPFLNVGGHAIYTYMATGQHTSWLTAYNSSTPLVPWLFAQRRGVISTADPVSTAITTVNNVPTNGPTLSNQNPTISLGGTSAVNDNTFLPGPISSVVALNDHFTNNKTWPGFNTTLATTVTGTTAWSASSLANGTPIRFYAMAEGNTFASNQGGHTFYPSPILTVNQNYHAAVTSPTNTGSFTTTSPTVNLAGTVTPDSGINGKIQQARWTNATTGDSGTLLCGPNDNDAVTGPHNWTANNIPLAAGKNALVISAYNKFGNYAMVDYVVTRDLPAPVLVAFGPDTVTDPSEATWNVTGSAPWTGGYTAALSRADGTASGITMTEPVGDAASVTPGSGVTFGYNSSGYNGPAGSIVFPAESLPKSATIGSWYLGNGHQSTLTFTGLDTTGTANYKFTFISARNGGSSGRTADFQFKGATTVDLGVIDSGAGVSTGNPKVFSASLKADSTGTIVLGVDASQAPASPGFGGYINALEIDITP